MNICVIGTGYVGLVTGACFAEFGVRVICADKDEAKIKALEQGQIPIYEPGLDAIVARNLQAGRLHFTTNTAEAVRDSLVVFIAVGTPPLPDGHTDLRYVEAVAREIGRAMDGYKVVVTKSTVPVGTSAKVKAWIQEELQAAKKKVRFSVASNPEFLREGAAIQDFMRPDRVVIGTEDDEAAAIMKDLYRPLYLIETPFVLTNIPSAELTKYAGNAFLAVKISFINEIADLAERVGADVAMIAKAMGLDRRIGPKFLHAGLGYGGSCLPKDTHAIVHIGEEAGVRMKIVRAAIDVNAALPAAAFAKARRLLPAGADTVALLGVSFKPNTDDIRSAASRPLVRLLLGAGLKVRAHDPVAMPMFREEFPQLVYADSAYDAAAGAHLCILVTEWNEYRQLDFARLGAAMAHRAFLDCRNVYDHERLAAHGFAYDGFGRPAAGARIGGA